MPTIAELIAEVQASDWDKGKEIARELGNKISELESVNQKAKNDLQQQAETILAVTAAEGTDFAEKLTDASKKIAKLHEEKQTLEQSKEAIATELAQVKQTTLFSEVKGKSGVNTNVLKALLKETDNLEIDGEKVKVNGVDIQDWAKTSQSDFYAALFPKTHADIDLPGGGSRTNDLPEGGSDGNVVELRPVEKMVATDFRVPDFVTVIGGSRK